MISSDVANTLDFPAPKFHLGEIVECEFTTRGEQQRRRGTVIGLEYISIEYALIDQTGHCGWHYTISTMVGKDSAEWVKVKDAYDVQWGCIESEMMAASAACECGNGVDIRNHWDITSVSNQAVVEEVC